MDTDRGVQEDGEPVLICMLGSCLSIPTVCLLCVFYYLKNQTIYLVSTSSVHVKAQFDFF